MSRFQKPNYIKNVVRKVALNDQGACNRYTRKVLKGIVGASSNVLGKNKAFLKLKYLL
jgi:hypothetical protein